MTKSINSESKALAEATWYGRLWYRLQHFPKVIAQGSQHPPEHSGPAAAAILSATFSCFFLMVNQHLTMVSEAWKNWVWTLGAWIPGSHNPDPLYGQIGPYAGKETLLIISWLGSWFILHQIMKNRQVKPRTIFFWMLTFLIAATVMNWHPFFPYAPLA